MARSYLNPEASRAGAGSDYVEYKIVPVVHDLAAPGSPCRHELIFIMHSHSSPSVESRSPAPPSRTIRNAFRSGLRLAEVRLRIPLVLLIAAIVIGRWEVLRNYWDKLTHKVLGQSSAANPVSNDIEFFCPMDPGVVSNWPGKCGICNMDLVRRKRGEAAALPNGVVARMQISPYRVQLAGIRTAPLSYEPLVRTYRLAGIVRKEGDGLCVPLEIPPRQAAWLKACQDVTIQCKDAADSRPTAGRLHFHDHQAGQDVMATVALSDRGSGLLPGMIVDVTCQVPVSGLEPFRSMPTDPPRLKADEPRRLYTCPEHPDLAGIQPGRCTRDGNELEARPLSDTQRVRWWCPMHPAVTADHQGERCEECGGMILKPRVLSFQPPGKVLTVPESAVIDTGSRTVVFIETMPGMFDGVEVVLGPRCGDCYPVVNGLEAGQRVAVAGAFLLDAETRLNPSLASSYFGAAGRARPSSPTGSITVASIAEGRSPLAKLDRDDRLLVERQKICPVTRKPLGSMGTPTRVVVADRVVFLCCDGCKETFAAERSRYLAVLPAQPIP